MTRLPAHLEIAALRRAAEAAGGFATVLARGERDAGAIALVIRSPGKDAALWERLPRPDGRRAFAVTRRADHDTAAAFDAALAARSARDPDLWLLEIDVPNGERFVANCAGAVD